MDDVILMAVTDTSFIELRGSLSGSNISSVPEMRLGLNLVHRPTFLSSRLAKRPTTYSYERSTPVFGARRRLVFLAGVIEGMCLQLIWRL